MRRFVKSAAVVGLLASLIGPAAALAHEYDGDEEGYRHEMMERRFRHEMHERMEHDGDDGYRAPWYGRYAFYRHHRWAPGFFYGRDYDRW